MDCRTFVDHLLDYCEGDLDSPDLRVAGPNESAPSSSAMRAHADGCGDCAAFLSTYEATIDLGRATFEAPLPADFEDEMARRLRDATRPEPA